MVSLEKRIDREMHRLNLFDIAFQEESLPQPQYPHEHVGMLGDRGKRAYTLWIKKNQELYTLAEFARTPANIERLCTEIEHLAGLFGLEMRERYIQLLEKEPEHELGSDKHLSLSRGFAVWIEYDNPNAEDEEDREYDEEGFPIVETAQIPPSRLH